MMNRKCSVVSCGRSKKGGLLCWTSLALTAAKVDNLKSLGESSLSTSMSLGPVNLFRWNISVVRE